ncbi:hypothetical protein Pfo_013611, partial [Paulownia fortunei]
LNEKKKDWKKQLSGLRELALNVNYQSQVSILGPVGYGPTTLPLRHSDLLSCCQRYILVYFIQSPFFRSAFTLSRLKRSLKIAQLKSPPKWLCEAPIDPKRRSENQNTRMREKTWDRRSTKRCRR